ncbi:hypothetical protein SAMN04488063_1953 [Halopelagius inordinatus]|uniref:Uncharacterized protein n=1 Tax=Halopelagius inordinatus TaxID=553467 RepID=A0A1I2RK12_9EURY|nr:hypothetical protein SAMN04488063_1953 [Halopelagius inordinatus]
MNRRAFLRATGVAAAGSLAGCSTGGNGNTAEGTTNAVADERARELAERFAPTVYFDANERWFPTDPRPYESDAEGRTVVDGFDAFEGYTRRSDELGSPPDPTVFFRAVEYENSPLAVVQFWFYSAFDQFTTNFHWHDWEVLHVFVDTETDEPQMYVASAHSPAVPNNEYIDPDPETVPRVLSELGSHSSTMSLNDRADSFQRVPTDGLAADITNRALDGLDALTEIPVAYGLPRDEGTRLPYLVPELDGRPLYEHDRLPSVEASSLVADELTVRSFADLTSPPTNLPRRETGLAFDYRGRETGADDGRDDAATATVAYDLVPTAEVEHISAFAGPRLGFEFAVPQFVEDAIEKHITTTDPPWTQTRYDDPATDITEPVHRATLAERYEVVGEPTGVNSVIASVTEAVRSADAPDDEGLTTARPAVEAVAFLQSDPVAVPTFGGIAVVRDVAPGEHRLTVNGAGFAPHSEPVTVSGEDDATPAGADGEIPLVASGDAVKLGIDADGTDADLTRLRVEDDFAGTLYDAAMDGPDAVYVHRGGAFTAEVRDAEDDVGAFRVNPGEESAVDIDRPRTGKASLAEYVADLSSETADAVRAAARDDASGSANAVGGLARALEAVGAAAARAAERADAGDRGNADRALEALDSNLERAAARLEDSRDGLPEPVAKATEKRFGQAEKRAAQALDARKL